MKMGVRSTKLFRGICRGLCVDRPWTRVCWHRFHRCINWVSVPVVGGGRGWGGVVTRTSSPEDCAATYITLFDRTKHLLRYYSDVKESRIFFCSEHFEKWSILEKFFKRYRKINARFELNIKESF